MEILPIKSFTESDAPIFGLNIFNLAKLNMNGLPVCDCLALSPPDFLLQTIMKHMENETSEVFEQKMTLIKKEIENTLIPEEFIKELGTRSVYFLNNIKFHNKKDVWQKLLEIWLSEIKSNIFRLGFDKNIKAGLSSQLIYFKENKNIIKAYFNPDIPYVVTEADFELTPPISKKINDLVIKANKTLFIPQIYYLTEKGGVVEIVYLQPYTQSQPLSFEKDVVIKTDDQKKMIMSAVKVFLNLKTGFAVCDQAEGLIVEAKAEDDFDESTFRLLEGGLYYANKPVIFQLPENAGFLLNKKEILEKLSKVFLFARNKKGLLNVELSLPNCSSVFEMLELKRTLATQGITRKGSMKIRQLISIPENVINLQNYLDEGLDGIIINLDDLQKYLLNIVSENPEFTQNEVSALLKFIEPVFKVCHSSKVPIIAKGSLLMHPEVLDLLVEKGIYAVVANNPLEAENMPETLRWVEERVVSKKLD
jgi:hypothetical protein